MNKKVKNEVKLLPGFFDRKNPNPTFTINGKSVMIFNTDPVGKPNLESLTDEERRKQLYLEDMEKINNLNIALNISEMMETEDDENELPF